MTERRAHGHEEQKFEERLGGEYVLSRDRTLDLVSAAGDRAIELKLGLQGARDLHAALLELSLTVSRSPKLRRVTLVAGLARMSAARVAEEWKAAEAVLRPDITRRLALVAWASEKWIVLPEADGELKRIEAAAREVLFEREFGTRWLRGLSTWTPARQEVWKVLLDAWLRSEPPLQLQEIAERAGCSLPTVGETLGRLETFDEVIRTSSRAASFRAMPRNSMRELLGTTGLMRDVARFVDTSGRRVDPSQLLKRLDKIAPPNVAVGGVVAARLYNPDFDLNGLPRLDVTVRRDDHLEWVRALDPALHAIVPGESGSAPPVLVVHASASAELRRHPRPGAAVPIADPAETLLDLHELGLTEQAEDFVRVMREKGRLNV